ncbi:type II toxin-antitoxin system VapC family toxin [Saccharopolyspora gloriosae]|uniref:type II toxin-antitoxin system VapC family toxin n=1 Tax=Saccharopolyspora gloriosae TaxID=455344 RepID=UPI001FB6D3C4|nr:PIN domain-containing protein [Saccharopolyspora gloriosae]
MGGPRIAAGGTLILDGSAVADLAAGGARVRGHLEIVRERRARVVISAVTLAEVLRGDAAGVALDEVLARIAVLPVTSEIARLAGKCSARGPGDQAEQSRPDADERTESTVDAIVAATALRCARPVVLLTAVPEVMRRLFAGLALLGEAEPSEMSEAAKVQAGEEILMDERGGGGVLRGGRPRVAIAEV